MPTDKNSLFTHDEYVREIKRKNQILNSQQFAVAGPSGLGPFVVQTGLKSNLEPIQDNFAGVGIAIKDFGTVALQTINIDFDDLGTQYNRFKVNDDITFAFNNFPLDKAYQFSFDIELTTTNPTITYPSSVKDLPTNLPTASGSRYTLFFSGYKDETEERFTVINSGASGVSFPIKYPVLDHGSPGATLTIDLSLTTAHVHLVTLTANLTITFTDDLTSSEAIPFHIEFTQDGTGGFTVSYTNTMNVEPVITSAANAVTLAVFETIDGGTTYYGLNTGGNSIVKDNLGDHTATQDINFATFDGTSIDRLRFVVSSGALSSPGDPSIFLDSADNMIHNIADTDEYLFLIQGAERIIFRDSAQINFEVRDDDGISPVKIISYRSDASPAIANIIGQWQMRGSDSSGASSKVPYTELLTTIEDATTTSHAGSLDINISESNNLVTYMSFNAANLNKILFNKTMGSQSGADIELNTGRLALDIDDDTYIEASVDDRIDFFSSGTKRFQIDSTGLSVSVVGTDTSFDIPELFIMLATTATGVADGVMWHDSGTGDVLVFSGGAERNLSDITAGGSSFADNVFDVHDDITPTKEITFQLVNATGTNIFDIFGTADTYTFPDGGGEVIMSQGTQTINGTKTFGNNVNLNGSTTTIGNAATDKIVFTAELASNFNPDGDGTRNIGLITDRFSVITSQVFRLPTTTADSTTRLLSDTDGIEYRALSGDAHEFFIDTTRVLSVTGSGTLLLADVAHTIVSNPGVNMTLDVDAGELIAFAVDGTVGLTVKDVSGDPLIFLKTYTDASRPTASAAGAGAVIFNSDDGGLNVSDGTNWRAPSGGWVNT